MNIINRLKMEFYAPQRNKAQKKVDGHRGIARYLEEKPLEKRSRREQATVEYNYSMADILEVVYRIAQLKGISKEELEKIRIKKADKRGSFDKNLFLIDTTK